MLDLINIRKTFNAKTVNEKVALNGAQLHLDDGDFVTVIGGNGAGKSTMLNAIAGVWPIDEGQIIIDGKEVCISEALRSKLFYRALDHDIVGIIEDDARKAAHKAADDKCDVDDLFDGYGGKWHEAFLTAYLEAAESDLIIDSAEIDRQEKAIAEREEAEALARIDMLP